MRKLALTLLLLSFGNEIATASHNNTFVPQKNDTSVSQEENNTFVSQDNNTTVNTTRPNIVLVLADDVGTGDLPFYWKKHNTTHVKMPNLESFSKKSVLFRDAHGTPLCAPSRYLLLSGNYPHRGKGIYGIWDAKFDTNQFKSYQKSIAEVLRSEAGYETGAFGKWHLGLKVPPEGLKSDHQRNMLTHEGHNWTQPLIQGPGDTGFDKSYISPMGIQNPPYSFFENDYLTTNVDDVVWWNKRTYDMPHGKSIIKRVGEGDPTWDSSAYDMIVVNKTRDFIDNHLKTDSNNPFFAYVALGAVHGPHSPPDYFSDGSQVSGVYETRHLDMLGAMDKAFGSIVKIIEDRNLSENTLIIFTSDNGGINKVSTETGHLTSGPLRAAKSSIYEGGHRVPLLMRYDGNFPQNKRRKQMVGLNDIYATICELVGIKIPVGSAQDSVSFAPYIYKGKNSQGLRKYLGTWSLPGGREHHWGRSLRKKNLKLVHHLQNNTFEMYNLKKDRGESKNVSDRKWIRKTAERMKQKLRELGPCPAEDAVGAFNVTLFNGTLEQYDCNWFREARSRCDEYLEGELKCPSVCNRYKYICGRLNWYS